MKKTPHILVTGANGLVGHHLCERLLAAGETVLALSRSDNPVLLQAISGHQNLTILKGDLQDVERLDDIFRSYYIATVFHLAVERYFPEKDVPPPPFSETNAYRTNYRGTLNALTAAAPSGTRHWIQGSAMLVYDLDNPPALPVSESAAPAPAEWNGESVLLAEKAVSEHCAGAGMNYNILRYPGIYGSGKSGGLIAAFTRKCLSGESGDFKAASDRSADFLHVEDAVAANLLALRQLRQADAAHKELYHIGSGRAIAIDTICRTIAEIAGGNMTIIAQESGSPREFYFDISRAERELGYQPEAPQKRLRQYVETIREQLLTESN